MVEVVEVVEMMLSWGGGSGGEVKLGWREWR